jgi:putative ABC transport system permease protein
MWQDLRYSIRTLLKNPGFAAVGLLVLALAIAVNTAIFTIVNAVLFRPLPVRAPDELMYLYHANPRVVAITYRDFLYLRENSDVFVDMLARLRFSSRLTVGGETDQVSGEVVTANYFDLLGVKAMLGRTFVAEDDQASNTEPAVVISHSLWKSRFNSDPGILGKRVELDRRPFTIIGVMGLEFQGISNPWQASQYWVPIAPWHAGNESVKEFFPTVDRVIVLGIGRLKPGVTAAQGRAIIATMGKQLQQAFHPDSRESLSLVLLESRRISLPFDPSGKVVPSRLATALMTVTGIVLLIAAANLAGILMARGVTRRGEIAVRLAFGAPRWRLMRQLFTESILLSMLGGVLGLLLARFLVSLFLTSTPGPFGRMQASLDVPIDIHVLLFTAVICFGAGVLVGLAPALQASKTDLLSSLSGAGIAAPRSVRSRLRHWIVIPQVCLSLVLLLVAGVLVRTLLRVELTDPGYNPNHLVFVDFNLPSPGREHRSSGDFKAWAEKRRLFDRRVLERAKASPEFISAGTALSLPSSSISMKSWVVAREGFFSKNPQYRWVSRADVSPGYFKTLEVPLLRGRDFDERDVSASPRVAIVCDALARWLWPGKDPIGEFLALHEPGSKYAPKWLEVVGVVKEVKPVLSEGGPNPTVYLPVEQGSYAGAVVARGYGSPAQLIRSLRKAVTDADVTAEISRSGTMTQAIAEIRYPRRMAAAILAVSGLIGLLLACVGIYGVVSYSVAQRIREIGIRAALGAQRRDILKLVIGEGVKVALIGSVLGAILSFAATRIASSYVVAIPAMDWITFIAVLLLLATVILLACYIPARCAARVDPMVALREL